MQPSHGSAHSNNPTQGQPQVRSYYRPHSMASQSSSQVQPPPSHAPVPTTGANYPSPYDPSLLSSMPTQSNYTVNGRSYSSLNGTVGNSAETAPVPQHSNRPSVPAKTADKVSFRTRFPSRTFHQEHIGSSLHCLLPKPKSGAYTTYPYDLTVNLDSNRTTTSRSLTMRLLRHPCRTPPRVPQRMGKSQHQ
jgi:hypothetical protein